MKKIQWNLWFVFLIMFLLTISCVKNDVIDNVVLEQAFSLPLGEKEFQVNADYFIITNDLNPTRFYYNGKPYLKPGNYFSYLDEIDFNLDSINKANFIQRIDLKIRIINNYPAINYYQLYLLDANRTIIDSVFLKNQNDNINDILGLYCGAGEVDNQDDPDVATTTLPEVIIFERERLERLKQTKILSFKMNMLTTREDGTVLRFSSLGNIKINVAMRLFLKYKLNEI